MEQEHQTLFTILHSYKAYVINKVWARSNFLLIPNQNTDFYSSNKTSQKKKKEADNIQSPKNTNHVSSKAWSRSNFLFITNQKK